MSNVLPEGVATITMFKIHFNRFLYRKGSEGGQTQAKQLRWAIGLTWMRWAEGPFAALWDYHKLSS